ncbi:MAG: type VI secretion system tip protein TssI/VgrG [Burkholderiaceae bacterium]
MAANAAAPELNDMARLCELKSPLGNDLRFSRMRVSEGVSRLFEIEIEAVSPKGDISPKALLGKSVTVEVTFADEKKRWYNGYVTRFGLGPTEGRYYAYRMTLRPWLWFLTRTTDCKIFQSKSVPAILKDVFHDEDTAAVAWRLGSAGAYKDWDYCVQYRESDFNFVSRLMEQEGIYYFFEHRDGAHELVVIDDKGQHKLDTGVNGKPGAGAGTYSFVSSGRGQLYSRDHVAEWYGEEDIQPGDFVLQEYHFEAPARDVKVKRLPEHVATHAKPKYEIFDFPGDYDSVDEGELYVAQRAEELNAQARRFHGSGPLTTFRGGAKFKLVDHSRDDQNGEYLLLSTDYEYHDPSHEAGDQEGSRFTCRFTAIPAKQQYRPPRVTPRPLIHGIQSAVVTGPGGEEIHTDKYGRVKVQFHWDRYGKKNDHTSCWLRVAFLAAGGRFGFVSIPRIGWEVIVSFMEGDPDRPLITGVVYNGANMPPWDLPANKTQWGMLSRSTKGAGAANANALRFEDKKGAEQVWLHAEKNQDIEVENDETHWVGHDRTKTIDHDETVHVKHDRTETVDNNETITVHNNRTERVDVNERISIGVNRTEDVGANESITIGANRTETVGANEKVTVKATRSHTVNVSDSLKVGAARSKKVGAAEKVKIGANQTISVGANQATKVGASQSLKVAADRKITVGGGETHTVAKDQGSSIGAGRTVSVKESDSLTVGKELSIDAKDSITLTSGKASITLKKDGTIQIKGKDIVIEASGKINGKADGDMVLKGRKITQN